MRYQFINLFNQAKNLIKQQPTEDKKDLYEGVTIWGVDQYVTHEFTGHRRAYNYNDFPQQLIQDVYNSPVASTALELWVEFIQGKGFEDISLNAIRVNTEGETTKDLLSKISYDVAHLEGFAVHVSYDARGQKTEYHHQPFEQTRLGEIKGGRVQDIKTNPYFGIPQSYDNKYTKTFYAFNDDPEHVVKEMEDHAKLRREGKVKCDYPGQIFWVSIEKPLARIYPQPFYYSGVNWFRIDAEIQKFHERNLKNNLIQSHILNVFGDPDEPIGEDDENGDARRTRGEIFEAALNSNARGAANGGGQLINWYTTEEEKLIPEAFPTNANDQLFQTLQDLTTSQIAISCKTPTALIGIQQEGKLGNNQEIINAVRVMQSNVKPKQKFITSNLVKLFQGSESIQGDFKIKDTNLINIIPEWAFEGETLSVSEKRDYLSTNFNIDLETSKNMLGITEGEQIKEEPEKQRN